MTSLSSSAFLFMSSSPPPSKRPKRSLLPAPPSPLLYEKIYCARGRMENLIKNMKLYTRSDRTSCHRWEANQFRLFLHMGAYWLLHELRGAAPKRSIWRTATFETIRCAFLKIAVRIEELKTRGPRAAGPGNAPLLAAWQASA